MKDLLHRFWMRCEDPEPIFSAEELRWPPGQVDVIRTRGLLAGAAKARWVSCDACDDGHVEDVAWIRNAKTGYLSPFIPCPEVGGAPVDPERLRRWVVDLDLTAQLIREGLGLIGPFAPLLPGRSLGRRHLAGRFRDFFFVCGAARPDASVLWERCRHIEDAPAPVVLVPARPPHGNAWRAKAAAVFRLLDVGTITEAGLDLDMAYIEDALPRDAHSVPGKSVASFPVPEGALWEELRITIRDTGIRAQLGSVSREFSIEDLGFASTEERPWQLLCLFARLGGQTRHEVRPCPTRTP